MSNFNTYIPPGYAQLTPYFIVDDAPGFMDFLAQAFQAKELQRSENNGRVNNIIAQLGSAKFMIGQSGEGHPAHTATHYLYVADVDQSHQVAVQAGCTELYPPADMPYGDRQNGVKDPFGNCWWISTRLLQEDYC